MQVASLLDVCDIRVASVEKTRNPVDREAQLRQLSAAVSDAERALLQCRAALDASLRGMAEQRAARSRRHDELIAHHVRLLERTRADLAAVQRDVRGAGAVFSDGSYNAHSAQDVMELAAASVSEAEGKCRVVTAAPEDGGRRTDDSVQGFVLSVSKALRAVADASALVRSMLELRQGGRVAEHSGVSVVAGDGSGRPTVAMRSRLGAAWRDPRRDAVHMAIMSEQLRGSNVSRGSKGVGPLLLHEHKQFSNKASSSIDALDVWSYEVCAACSAVASRACLTGWRGCRVLAPVMFQYRQCSWWKEWFRIVLLRFKDVSTKYAGFIRDLRNYNMSTVPVDVGMPLKARLQRATSALRDADSFLPDASQRVGSMFSRRVGEIKAMVERFRELVENAVVAVFMFEKEKRHAIKVVTEQRMRLMAGSQASFSVPRGHAMSPPHAAGEDVSPRLHRMAPLGVGGGVATHARKLHVYEGGHSPAAVVPAPGLRPARPGLVSPDGVSPVRARIDIMGSPSGAGFGRANSAQKIVSMARMEAGEELSPVHRGGGFNGDRDRYRGAASVSNGSFNVDAFPSPPRSLPRGAVPDAGLSPARPPARDTGPFNPVANGGGRLRSRVPM